MHQLAERHRHAAVQDLGADRLVEQGKVAAAERDLVVKADPALVDRIHRRDRHPQLGAALLREEPGGIVVGLPAFAERNHRNPGDSIEASAERV